MKTFNLRLFLSFYSGCHSSCTLFSLADRSFFGPQQTYDHLLFTHKRYCPIIRDQKILTDCFCNLFSYKLLKLNFLVVYFSFRYFRHFLYKFDRKRNNGKTCAYVYKYLKIKKKVYLKLLNL